MLTLIGALCVHLGVGSQYAWGSISPYLVGYFRDMGKPANMSQFYIVLPLIVIISTFVFPLATFLFQYIGPKGIIGIGAIFTVVVTAFSTLATEVWLFFFLYSVGFGTGKGFLYPTPLNAGWSHLPARKGLVSGIIISGLGLGSFFVGLLVNRILNPNNVPPQPIEVSPGVTEYVFPPEINREVPRMILILCAIWTALLLFGILTVSKYKAPFEE